MKLLAYLSLAMIICISCESTVGPSSVNCNQSDLELVISSFEDATACNSQDGSIVVMAMGGQQDYQYRINGGPLQSDPVFSNLGSGIYTIDVMDEVGCERSVSATISSGSGIVIDDIVTTDSGCSTSNGSITVSGSGGTGLMYSINGAPYTSSNVFQNLAAGDYTIFMKDDTGCEFSTTTKVNTGIPFATIKEIIDTNCATSTSCHGGNEQGSGRNFTIDQNIINNAQAIKRETSAKSMPPPTEGSLTDEEIAQIACWVDDGANGN